MQGYRGSLDDKDTMVLLFRMKPRLISDVLLQSWEQLREQV